MKQIDNLFEDLKSKDNKIRFAAFEKLQQITEQPVDWVYDKWYELVEKLESKNSFQRSIGLILLANLCKSDSEYKMGEILNNYLGNFDDEKFITSRQCIQNVWKVAISNDKFRVKVLEELENTYFENIHINRHGNLIKQDVVFSLYKVFKVTKNKEIFSKINELIDSETDAKIIKSLKKIMDV